MQLIVSKTKKLQGIVHPPGSKSQSIRGIFISLLATGQSTLLNILDSDDTRAAMGVGTALGAVLTQSQIELTLTCTGLPLVTDAEKINTDNSGITTLFTLPLLGLRANCASPILVDCGEQMRLRPIKSLVDALCRLGMRIQYVDQNNRLPLSVTGNLIGGSAEVDGDNSQYLSALLIGLPCALNDSVITVKALHERPYVDMTLDYLKQQGIMYTHKYANNMDTFYIRGNQRYTPFQSRIKGDFSSASCLIAAAVVLQGEVELQGLDYEDTQGDKRLITILQEMGADIVISHEKIRINGNKTLTGIRIDANTIPDLVPALAVIATQAVGKTEIYNVKQARIKETDRIHSMVDGLIKMGARVEEYPDGMTVHQSNLHGTFVRGYGDHRTVMALTVAGLLASGTTVISDGEAIRKTYPKFIETMQAIGADITMDQSVPVRNSSRVATSDHSIVLIGFKHVGKTRIGQQLAKVLNKKFIDLDKSVEDLYEKKHHECLTCRQIMNKQGESYFRKIESEALQKVSKQKSCVLSLGGGASLSSLNQAMIKSHVILHVVAPREVVFKRIMTEGCPAFFDPNENPYEAFNRLWNKRDKVYRKITSCIVDNSGSVEQAVIKALAYLH